MRYTTVLFDLDGTLTDSQAGIVASYRHALGAFGLVADEAAIKRWIGPPLEEGLAALGVPAGQLEDATAVYRGYFGETGMYDNRLFDGVVEMLAALRAAGMTVGLATSKLQRFAEAILDHLKIRAHFTAVAGASAEESRRRKDDVVAYALQSLGRPEPSSVALVGDREDDMRAAVRHGLYPIGAAWGYGDQTELQAAGSAVIVDSPSAVTAVLLDCLQPCEPADPATPFP